MQRVASVAAVLLAVVSWAAVAALMIEPLVSASRTQGDRAPDPEGPDPDPCALRQPLPAGTDVRCDFRLARRGKPALLVELDQRWESNALTQRLTIREPGTAEPLHFVFARGAPPRPSRVHRLFAVAVASGEEHLVYVVGQCGAPACPRSEAVIVGAPEGQISTLLKLTLAGSADVTARSDGAILILDGVIAGRSPSPGTYMARTYRWQDGLYRLERMDVLSPSPRPR